MKNKGYKPTGFTTPLGKTNLWALPFMTYQQRGGFFLYHIRTKLADGTILDPSAELGMLGNA